MRGESSTRPGPDGASVRSKDEMSETKQALSGMAVSRSSSRILPRSPSYSKDTEPASTKHAMKKRTAVVWDQTPASKRNSMPAPIEDIDYDSDGSNDSTSSVVIHDEEQILSDDEVSTPKTSDSPKLPPLDLSHVPRSAKAPEESTPPSVELKLRAHAAKERLPVAHGPKLRAWKKSVGGSWTTPILGDNTRAFVIATIESMYLSGQALVSQKFMARYRGLPPPSPLLKAHIGPLKSSLPDDFDLDDLDDEIETDELEPTDHISRPQASTSPHLISPRIKIVSSASTHDVPTSRSGSSQKSGETPLSPILPSKSLHGTSHSQKIPINASTTIDNDSTDAKSAATGLKSSGEISKRQGPNTGLLSGLIGKIRRQPPVSSPNSPTADPQTSLSNSVALPSSPASPGSASVIPQLDSILANLRRKFRPWERLRRLRSSDATIPPPDPSTEVFSPQSRPQLASEHRPELNEKGSDHHKPAISLKLKDVLRKSGDHAENASVLFDRDHDKHAQKFTESIESEVIRGPYFQRLQAHSKQMTHIADNMKYLYNAAQDDLHGVNEALERLTTGHEKLEVQYKRISRQLEDTKHRALSTNVLLHDHISKARNAIHYLKFKQKTKPPMKVLLAVLGWLVLLVGTLIWLFAAAYRAVMRVGRISGAIVTGSSVADAFDAAASTKSSGGSKFGATAGARRPSHPTRRGGSTATDPQRFIPITSKSYGQLLQSSGGPLHDTCPGADGQLLTPENIGVSSSSQSGDYSPSSNSSIPSSKSSSLRTSVPDLLNQSYSSSSGSSTAPSETEEPKSTSGDSPNSTNSVSRVSKYPLEVIDEIDSSSETVPQTPQQPLVLLEPQQLQTLEDMSKSIKALRLQDKAAKKKAALERAKSGSPR